jgi:GntR family transcriptional regulator
MIRASQVESAKQWTDSALRPTLPVPLYYQLELRLRSQIKRGRLRPGEMLPSEARLSAVYGVSRITVRRALEELGRDGLLVTRRGVGTFVADPEWANVDCLTSFTADALRRGQVPGTRVLDFRIVKGVQPAASKLEVSESEPLLLVKRLRMINGQPIFVSLAYIPRRLAPHLVRSDFQQDGIEQSLFYTIQTKCELALEEGEEVTCAVLADDDTRALLGLPAASPVVKRACLLHDARRSPILYDEAIWGRAQTSRVKVDKAMRSEALN